MSMTIEGLKEQQKQLDNLLMKNPEMEKRVQQIIRKVLNAARKQVGKDAKLGDDPRHTYKAVKSAVYRRILGGNISILNKRKATGRTTNYEPPRRLKAGQRGGNRVLRGSRTQQVIRYEGVDRAFIARFVNSGTSAREAGTRGGKLSGNRGRISARNWFAPSAERAMAQAIEQLEQEVEKLWAANN